MSGFPHTGTSLTFLKESEGIGDQIFKNSFPYYTHGCLEQWTSIVSPFRLRKICASNQFVRKKIAYKDKESPVNLPGTTAIFARVQLRAPNWLASNFYRIEKGKVQADRPRSRYGSLCCVSFSGNLPSKMLLKHLSSICKNIRFVIAAS